MNRNVERPPTVEVDGVRYYIEALDLDRLYANLVKISEEATELHLQATREPEDLRWLEKAEKADEEEKQIRALIKAKKDEV